MVEPAALKPNPFVERFVGKALDNKVTDAEIHEISVAKEIRSWGEIPPAELKAARDFRDNFMASMVTWAKDEVAKGDLLLARIADDKRRADPKLSDEDVKKQLLQKYDVEIQRLTLAEAFLDPENAALRQSLLADATRMAATLEKEKFSVVTQWIGNKYDQLLKK